MRFTIITIYPRFARAFLEFGVGKAFLAKKLGEVQVIDLRDFAYDDHASVDDKPYGGGDGMVMRPDCLLAAIKSVPGNPRVILLSVSGQVWEQKKALEVSQGSWGDNVVLICGRFAGVDQRFVDQYVDEEVSLGNFVCAGGELGALVVLESVLRLLPDVLGNPQSAKEDSLGDMFDGGLEYPLYTKPLKFGEQEVPEVLLSGDHKAINTWRERAARERTQKLRPDLKLPKQP